MNRKHPEYTYERDGRIWCVVKWRKSPSGGYIGEKIATHVLKENARSEVYRLNGWNKKQTKID